MPFTQQSGVPGPLPPRPDGSSPEQGGSALARPFTVGSILGRSLDTLLKNPAVFVGIGLVAMLPTLLLSYLLPGTTTDILNFYSRYDMLPPFWENAALVQLTEYLTETVVQGAAAFAVFQVLRGVRVGLGGALKVGLTRLGAIVLASLMISVGTAIGAIFLVIPGIILGCMWQVAIPACVVERLGPVESLSRSASLTSGHKWTIFLVVVVAWLIAGVLTAGLNAVFGLLGLGSPFIALVVRKVVSSVPTAFICIVAATIYYDLRAIKEGVSLDSLANVFD